jgi:hypothetical protein
MSRKRWFKRFLKLPDLPLQAVREALGAANDYLDGYIRKHDRRKPTGPLLLTEYEAGKKRRASDQATGEN